MYPKAEEILPRTLFMGIPVKMADERIDTIAAAAQKAAKAI
jgi:hypothetical protein